MPILKHFNRMLRVGTGGAIRLPAGALTLAVTGVGGAALSPTSGNLTVTVNKSCTLNWRIYSGAVPTDKVAGFPNETFLEGAGTYTFPNGGTLSANTAYGCAVWATDGTTETAIISTGVPGSTPAFTTPSAAVNTAPTTITFSNGQASISASEGLPIGSVVGQLVSNGVPTATFTETADPNSKFTVASNGQVTLSATLDYAAAQSHTFTVTATNTEDTSSGITLTVNVAEVSTGGGAITPTVTLGAATSAALNAQLASWHNDGVTATRYIACPAGNYGQMTISGYTFAGEVVIYSAGENFGAVFSGVYLNNCTNVTLYAIDVIGVMTGENGANGVNLYNLTSCKVDGCDIRGATTEPATSAEFTGIGIKTTGLIDDLQITNCKVAFYVNGINIFGSTPVSTNGILIEGCVFDTMRADCIRVSHVGYNTKLRRNWFNRTRKRGALTHSDALQFKGGSGLEVEGNVILLEDPFTGIMQGLFHGDVNQTLYQVALVTQNIVLCNSTRGISTVPPLAPHGPCTYNDVIRGTDIPNTGVVDGGTRVGWTGVSDYHIVAARNNRDVGQGVNGVKIDVGDINGSNDPFVIAQPINPAVYVPYYAGNIGGEDSPGGISMIGDLMPPDWLTDTTTRTHWNTTDPAGPVGAYLRKQEIAVLGIHPGNNCIGRIATFWQSTWNADGAITS